jgi:hypothetical protein
MGVPDIADPSPALQMPTTAPTQGIQSAGDIGVEVGKKQVSEEATKSFLQKYGTMGMMGIGGAMLLADNLGSSGGGGEGENEYAYEGSDYYRDPKTGDLLTTKNAPLTGEQLQTYGFGPEGRFSDLQIYGDYDPYGQAGTSEDKKRRVG